MKKSSTFAFLRCGAVAAATTTLTCAAFAAPSKPMTKPDIKTETKAEMNEMWGDTAVQPLKQGARAEWFKASKYALFIHWSLFSNHANRWDGKTLYGIGEWLTRQMRVPVKDYDATAKDFNPTKFDAKAWVRFAKAAGFRYIVITAKHHEGFAMFKSAHPFNIVDATPFKRDPMKELADACRAEGLQLGFYYSQFQDWHEINDWDKDLPKVSFEQMFQQKILPQVDELCTNYGPLAMIWFDTPGNMTREQSQALVDLIRKRQPQALINSRIGNGVGDYSTYGDHEIPPRNVDGLWEAVDTTNDSWGYAWYDENWKDTGEVLRRLIRVTARGGNYMLNIGPRGDGTIPETCAKFLEGAGPWLRRYGKAIYGAKPSPWQRQLPWGDCTVQNSTLYLHVFDWQAGGELYLPGLKNKIVSATLGGAKPQKIEFTQGKDGWTRLQLPLQRAGEIVPVIAVTLDGAPQVDSAAYGIDPQRTTVLLSDFATASGAKAGKDSWMEKFGEWKHVTKIGDWKDLQSSAQWTINLHKPGRYFVDYEYNAPKPDADSPWDLVAEKGSTLRAYLTETTGEKLRPRFLVVRQGIITFSAAGSQTLTLKPAEAVKGSGIRLHALHLTPVD